MQMPQGFATNILFGRYFPNINGEGSPISIWENKPFLRLADHASCSKDSVNLRDVLVSPTAAVSYEVSGHTCGVSVLSDRSTWLLLEFESLCVRPLSCFDDTNETGSFDYDDCSGCVRTSGSNPDIDGLSCNGFLEVDRREKVLGGPISA